MHLINDLASNILSILEFSAQFFNGSQITVNLSVLYKMYVIRSYARWVWMRVIMMSFNFGKNWVNQMRFSFYRRLILLPVCILMDSLDSPLNLVNNVLFCLTVWFDFVKQHRDWHVCVTSWYMRVVTSLYNADML